MRRRRRRNLSIYLPDCRISRDMASSEQSTNKARIPKVAKVWEIREHSVQNNKAIYACRRKPSKVMIESKITWSFEWCTLFQSFIYDLVGIAESVLASLTSEIVNFSIILILFLKYIRSYLFVFFCFLRSKTKLLHQSRLQLNSSYVKQKKGS